MSKITRIAILSILVIVCCGFLTVATADKTSEAKISDGLENTENETVDVVVRFQGDPPGADTVGSMKSQVKENRKSLEAFSNSVRGLEIKSSLWLANAAVVSVDTGRVSLDELASVQGVEYIHRNFRLGAHKPTDVDTKTPTRAAGDSLSQSDAAAVKPTNTYTYGLRQIKAAETWNTFGTKGQGVKVVVLDTGVNVSHPDIELYTENPSDPTYPGGWAEFDSNGNEISGSEPYDDDGHGTHVSGTVAGGNASGTAIGVAPDAQLMHGRVLTDNGTGSFAQIIGGMQWAVDNDAEVISMSLGIQGYYPQLIDPVRNAQSQGTVVIASSGNSGQGTSGSPGNVYDSMSVGASNQNRDIASFSSGETIDTDQDWGNSARSDWPDQYVVPDVAAPGSAVKSADYQGGYTDKFGTSMAAPHVSGAAALMESATPDDDLSPSEIRTALESTARKPNGWNEPDDQRDDRYGYGIIDAYNATLEVTGPAPASFEVSNLQPSDANVTEGDAPINVTADVENVGGTEGTQNITLEVTNASGTVYTDTTVGVELGAGNSTTVEYAGVPAGQLAPGNYTHTVSSEDDTASGSLTVRERVGPPNYQIQSLTPTDLRIAQGYRLSAIAEITNTGEGSGDAEANLELNGTVTDNISVNIDSGKTMAVQFNTTHVSLGVGDYQYGVVTQNDTLRTNLTVVSSAFDERLVNRNSFLGPPTNTGELDPTLYEDLSGDGDGTSVRQTVTVFGELIRENDLGLTDDQARKLDWNDGSPETEVTVADMVTLFGKQIRAP